ncbi:cysteine desulfurase [Liquorilactobacillus sucicola DSM 21376 = JCM 15457]|uniref:Cysteine desulfurase selenocysteine lyase n=1 Tax=Liquorilactobacillus sucicola DSM 21376 = JCM 15457 TaxID=1423806 RepID=A0A023CUX1_9LACO|nr:cysteine desulfurase family protein [Liquorilactobacillus sucicola]KRN05269.1 cysteine desulfurase selenocysteine lyase [Liquorilactobacillus sucicola DSM 21376 = JCM 15457]GAJ25330.1 cysteine desulfurase [Liquorilactobacillus sucicola DSM 21376 = JCM 15457]
MKRIYFDNAATTPMAKPVVETMNKMMLDVYGNASSTHYFGRKARSVLDDSRHVIAQSINARKDDEIVFTSGGTESDNTAIIETALARKDSGRHLITTAIEHEAVLKSMEYLETLGFEVTYLPVDEKGHISLNDLKDALRDDTILVSIMMGNNEVGSRMPIHAIGQIVASTNAWFHTDAVQAYGLLDIDVQKDKIDLMSTSAHKLNGPKFLGFLYRREGLNFASLLKGGDQELKRRAGTENIPAIAGFATAVNLVNNEEKAARQKKYAGFKKQLISGLQKKHIEVEVNGDLASDNLQHVLNLWFKGCSHEALLTNLDLNGIAASAGSACTAGSIEPSHVLTAMYGKESPRIVESLRFSFGYQNTAADIEYLIDILANVINKMKGNEVDGVR